MKRFIRFLARISGVEEDIRTETIERIGGQLKNHSYWFTGIYYGRVIEDLEYIFRALYKIGNDLQSNHRYNISRVRDDIVEWIDNGKKFTKDI